MLLCVAGLKGGVGKTTLAAQLATQGLARGLRVLAIDLDPARGLGDVMDAAATMGHRVPPTAALGPHAPTATWLQALARGFELTIIDCPPGDRETLQMALAAADLAVLPTTAAHVDLLGLSRTATVVRRARRSNRGLLARVALRDGANADGAASRLHLRQLRIPVLHMPSARDDELLDRLRAVPPAEVATLN